MGRREAQQAARREIFERRRLENKAILEAQPQAPSTGQPITTEVAQGISEEPQQKESKRRKMSGIALVVQRRIKMLREDGEETAEAFAARIGIPLDTIYSIESGRRTPNANTLRRVAEGGNTTVSFLVGEVHDRSKEAVIKVSDLPFPKEVDTLIRERGFNYTTLSVASGISRGTFSDIVNKGYSPRLPILEQLAHALKLPIGRFFGEQLRTGRE